MAIYGDDKHTSDEKKATGHIDTSKKKVDENNLATWPVRKLKARAMGLFCSIYQTECFASHDLLELDAVKAELERRGYEFQESKSLSIVKA